MTYNNNIIKRMFVNYRPFRQNNVVYIVYFYYIYYNCIGYSDLGYNKNIINV